MLCAEIMNKLSEQKEKIYIFFYFCFQVGQKQDNRGPLAFLFILNTKLKIFLPPAMFALDSNLLSSKETFKTYILISSI